MASGFVGVLTCELHFPSAHSLKEKRHHLRSAKAQLQNRFGASVAEVDHHDVWQRARVTVACVARLLLAGGADTEATADHGFTPLQSAAANGSAELVELLLAHGARPDARNENGQTAIDLAKTDDVRALML